jgi:hypothetical protein
MTYPFNETQFLADVRSCVEEGRVGIIRPNQWYDMRIDQNGKIYTLWNNGCGRNIYAHIEGNELVLHGQEYVAELRRDTPSGRVQPVGRIPLV